MPTQNRGPEYWKAQERLRRCRNWVRVLSAERELVWGEEHVAPRPTSCPPSLRYGADAIGDLQLTPLAAHPITYADFDCQLDAAMEHVLRFEQILEVGFFDCHPRLLIETSRYHYDKVRFEIYAGVWWEPVPGTATALLLYPSDFHASFLKVRGRRSGPFPSTVKKMLEEADFEKCCRRYLEAELGFLAITLPGHTPDLTTTTPTTTVSASFRLPVRNLRGCPSSLNFGIYRPLEDVLENLAVKMMNFLHSRLGNGLDRRPLHVGSDGVENNLLHITYC